MVPSRILIPVARPDAKPMLNFALPRLIHIARSISGAVTAVMLLAGSLGCQPSGPTIVPVSGKVLLDGKPLTQGNVLTHPSGGRGANGVIQPDGTFRLKTGNREGAMIGTHKVGVIAYEGKAGSGPEAVGGKIVVPDRFTNPETSGLTIEVSTADRNEPVLELSSP